jgi:hypothetical protein
MNPKLFKDLSVQGRLPWKSFHNRSFDLRRFLAFGGYGFLIYGPVASWFYSNIGNENANVEEASQSLELDILFGRRSLSSATPTTPLVSNTTGNASTWQSAIKRRSLLVFRKVINPYLIFGSGENFENCAHK